MEIISRLIDHTVTYQSLPVGAVASSKRFILDTLGARLAGSGATGCAAVATCLTT